SWLSRGCTVPLFFSCPAGSAATLAPVSQQARRVPEVRIARRLAVFIGICRVPTVAVRDAECATLRHPERARNRKFHGASFRAAPQYSVAQLRGAAACLAWTTSCRDSRRSLATGTAVTFDACPGGCLWCFAQYRYSGLRPVVERGI